MEVSVFDDLKDEITRPDVEANTDTGRNQLEEKPDTVDKQENKVNRNSIGRRPCKNFNIVGAENFSILSLKQFSIVLKYMLKNLINILSLPSAC